MWKNTIFQIYRQLSSVIRSQSSLAAFRTCTNDPREHTVENVGQVYTIEGNEANALFSQGGFPPAFAENVKTFTEASLIVRYAGINVISCLKAYDYTKPNVRFLVYGPMGSGKTLTLAHLVHYAYKASYVIMHAPHFRKWFRYKNEFSDSEMGEGLVDINLDAAAWILHFQSQNRVLLNGENRLSTTREHVWNKRESTAMGAPLNDIAEYGVSRIKYATRCVDAIIDEVMESSNLGVCRTLVVIDGLNVYFHENCGFYYRNQRIPHNKVTLANSFLKLLKPNWHNAATVVVVDEEPPYIPVYTQPAEKSPLSYMPLALLGKKPFQLLDPFVPIKVNIFSQKEAISLLDYYRERRWIRSYNGLDDELLFLSGRNPQKLMEYCTYL